MHSKLGKKKSKSKLKSKLSSKSKLKTKLKVKSKLKSKSKAKSRYAIKLLFILLLLIIEVTEDFNKIKTVPNKYCKIKIGIISEHFSQNIGNNLLKYAMFIKIKELGFEPQIVGHLIRGNNISELNKSINIRLINSSFSEINKNDYDILMVNSDQVWRKGNLFCFDIGFLNFSKNWNITKFIYGASLGSETWRYGRNENVVIKELLKQFKGISVREKGTIKLVQNHFNITPILVADPTLLIDKKYYLDLIKDYKNEFFVNESYIFAYNVERMLPMEIFIRESAEMLNYEFYICNTYDKDYLKKFIYGIYNCKAVITNSYHGILFSIIFGKPFVAFNPKHRGNDRFKTLKEVFGLQKRIVSEKNPPNISLLIEPLDIDMNIIDKLKKQSNNYLNKILGVELKKMKNNNNAQKLSFKEKFFLFLNHITKGVLHLKKKFKL